jgi:flavin reductase (DIM6/NTAB) family NADH-FMN oxidoreductase RutF
MVYSLATGRVNMKKVTGQKNRFCLPGTQTILGSHFEGKVNFMALNRFARVNFDPPMIGVCINISNASHEALLDTGEFSVNVPSVNMVEVTDYVGLVSARRVDKSVSFEVFYGELKAAPMISVCPVNLECKVLKKVELPSNTFFIADIVNIYSEDKYLTEGQPDIKKINPFVVTMPDNRFWAIGECVGRAWDAGRIMRKGKKPLPTSEREE